MYAITGITGKVGGAVARTLLAAGQPVRAVVRDAARARSWAERGCEVVTADMDDAASLTAAFEGTQGVFILPPSDFDPSPGFPEARAVIDAVRAALQSASAGQGCLPVDDWRAGHRDQSAHATHADGAGAARAADAGDIPASRLVHGKRSMGRGAGPRYGDDPQLFATARQARTDGRDGRRRPCRRATASARPGAVCVSSSWRGRSVSPRTTSRTTFARILGHPVVPRSFSATLGGAVPLPRHEGTVAAHAHARRIQ